MWSKTRHIFFILFFVSSSIFAQDIEFTTKASKTTLGVNQRLKIEFNINKNGADNFKAPDFKNFTVVAGPSSSVSQSWINGKSTYSQSYIYIIKPKAVGTFTIAPAKIQYKGNWVESNTLKIIVTKKVAIPKNPNDPNYIAQENIFLVASVSNTKPYVGEGIYVEYRLYFSDKIGFGNTQFGKNPKYEGFWNQEITIQQNKEKIGEYRGKEMRYYPLKKMLLIPQKSGKLYINPMDLEMIVSVPTGRFDFFGNPQTRRINAQYTSTKKLVQVKPLPLSNKPLDFTGAVGDFSLDVKNSKNSLKANEATQIEVKVKGKGNLKLFAIPKLVVPADLEVYTPERKQHTQTVSNGLKGYISDNYSIVPEYKGKYKIPTVSFSYFNPKEQQYHTLTSKEIIIDVIEGKTLRSTTDDSITTKQLVTLSGGDFRYIHSKAQFNTQLKKDFYKSKLYYLLLFIPIISIPFGILIDKKRKKMLSDITGTKIKKADRLAKKYLSEAKKKIKDQEAFYIALEKALHNFLKAKLHIETADSSREKITELLKVHQVKETTISDFMCVLDDCNFGRYASSNHIEIKKIYEKARKIINQINLELR
jgi:hypothetical protein